jgi:ABC-type lipoprotein release transport system permease subunit
VRPIVVVAAGPVLLLVTALLASALPASRAAPADPTTALHHQ